ncbi:hypothetical protein FSP39_022709 [Pinctada imbricata]|uniref:Uncharacterized protein n=1 Tax=Pinctada imbricata TaxID=66713 RepID=A0AA89C2D4_PINIB|nr:hypothetical protein FSP39_022709 [Pinctada imbricata]
MSSKESSSSSSCKLKRGYPRSSARQVSSSSSSPFEQGHSYLSEKGVPKFAALWKKQHLQNLEIVYNDSPSSMTDILDVVKKQVMDLNMDTLPEIAQKLKELTKLIFDFSFNFNDPINSEINLRKWRCEMERTCRNFESIVTDFKSQNNDLLQNGINERNGDSLMSTCKVKGKTVSGMPDVRFPCYQNGDEKTIKIVTMAEVKHSDAWRGNRDSFHIENLTDDVLGQHGAELLLEYYRSLFRPAVSGLICIGTKLIFTILEIDGMKYGQVQADNVEGMNSKSTILYTKPYDYMDSRDRNDILNLFFWFGFVQHNAYKSFIPS